MYFQHLQVQDDEAMGRGLERLNPPPTFLQGHPWNLFKTDYTFLDNPSLPEYTPSHHKYEALDG